MTLTEDQRLLLYGMGGWPIVYCLAAPEYGIPHLFQSMMGGSMLNRIETLRPEWAGYGYQTEAGAIHLGWLGDNRAPEVVVTRTQLATFARTIPASMVRRLQACRRDATSLASVKSENHRANYVGDFASLDRHRPAWSIDLLRADRRRMHWAIRDRETALLREALGIDNITDEPTDLLELLAVNE